MFLSQVIFSLSFLLLALAGSLSYVCLHGYEIFNTKAFFNLTGMTRRSKLESSIRSRSSISSSSSSSNNHTNDNDEDSGFLYSRSAAF
jgi:hypothetical protein